MNLTIAKQPTSYHLHSEAYLLARQEVIWLEQRDIRLRRLAEAQRALAARQKRIAHPESFPSYLSYLEYVVGE